MLLNSAGSRSYNQKTYPARGNLPAWRGVAEGVASLGAAPTWALAAIGESRAAKDRSLVRTRAGRDLTNKRQNHKGKAQ